MSDFYSKRDTCRLCGSKHLDVAVPLAPMPIATTNFLLPGFDRSHPVFKQPVPLDLMFCRECGLLQVVHIGNPELQYRNYIYTTSISLGLREHFAAYTREVVATIQPQPGALVVEMGSNDGTLLGFFKELGLSVQGVDPATEIARQATVGGIPTLGTFFNQNSAAQILAERGPAALIIANNVLANIDDLSGVTAGIRTLLTPDGVFVFETQYGADVIEKNLLDTVYHEHLSYFDITPLHKYFAANCLRIIDVQRIWTKGGSIRVMVQRAECSRAERPSVAAFLAEEQAKGMFKPAYYRQLTSRLAKVQNDLAKIVGEEKAKGKKICGYGASVGTTALLPQFKVAQDIDVIFDDDPKKGSLLSGPDYDIPIVSSEKLAEMNPGAVIVFAWRYIDTIVARNKKYINNGGKFIIPLPDVSIERG
ncbi:conserved hypothetical protein [Candidatus Terasakiella magnetica]|nr:conserved hypothetical protein [Candidatus Terasakiella magnetica]